MRVIRYSGNEYVETEAQTFEPLFSENTPLINGEIVLTVEEYREVLNTYKQLQQERERAEQCKDILCRIVAAQSQIDIEAMKPLHQRSKNPIAKKQEAIKEARRALGKE